MYEACFALRTAMRGQCWAEYAPHRALHRDRDHPAPYARAGIAGRLAAVIVGACVDHQCAAEDIVRSATAQRHARKPKID